MKEKTKEELQLENEILRFALDKVHEGVYITDDKGIIIEYNSTVQDSEHYSVHDVIGRPEQEVYGQVSDYDFIQNYSVPVRTKKRPVENVYYEYPLGFGKKTAMMMSVYPFIVDDRVKAVCTIGRDVSQVKDFLIETLGMRNWETRSENPQKTGARYFFEDIIGKSEVMKHTIERAKLVAKRDSPVLIYGETGTGKELMAQSIHNGSLFLDGPFVSVNCAAIPETLLESILFGVHKGAFTGAVEGPGLFEQAEGGTLFLDEINSMPLNLQPKILRAIQERSVRRVGGNKEIPVNCRIISAVNEDPKWILEKKLIRDDLFFRLATIEVKIPPLRERKEDLEYLIYSFIHKYNIRFGLFVEGISPTLFNILMDYDWPGNIRELENMVESSMNLIGDDEKLLRPYHLSDYFQEKFATIHHPAQTQEPETHNLKAQLLSYERKLMKESLIRNDYNTQKVAEEFGMTRQNVYLRIKKLGISIEHKTFLD